MPRNKDLKRLVRARMRKTGEAYTTARAQLLKKRRRTTRAATTAARRPARAPNAKAAAAAALAKELEKLAGMSDAIIKEKTGCNWARWVAALDYHGAAKMSHGDIAKLVHEKYKVGDWWTQTVTVGYERIKGLRAVGQRRDGSYEANKSRTFNVPVTTLFDAWADTATRRQWLNGTSVKVRTATAPKSMRLDWAEGGIVAIGFWPKGEKKSAVSVQHTKLPDKATAERLKKEWADHLDALGKVLAG